MINIIYSTASIPDIIHEYILPSCMDVFYDPKILNILYKNKWNSIFIYENKNFFFHIHTPNQIPSTDYFDIEPWFGYRGPIIVSDSQEFLKKALIKYIDICKERKIVSEIIRFDPIREYHKNFYDLENIMIINGRKISYISSVQNCNNELLKSYPNSTQRQIKNAEQLYSFREINPSLLNEFQMFIELYYLSLDKVKADQRWYFDSEILKSLTSVRSVKIFGVFINCSSEILISAALVLFNNDTAHTLLIANNNLNDYKGGSDYLYHKIAVNMFSIGIKWICLGGGRSNSEDDSLLKFKSKFCGNNIFYLPIGIILHDTEKINFITKQLKNNERTKSNLQPSIEIIERFMPYKLFIK